MMFSVIFPEKGKQEELREDTAISEVYLYF